MGNSHKIAIVFDRCFGMDLIELADKMHVWIVSSEMNDAAVKAYASQAGRSKDDDPLSSGVTEFCAVTMTPDLLNTIWEHHGEFAHEPPLSKMRVIGLAPDRLTIDILKEFCFEIRILGATSFEAYLK